MVSDVSLALVDSGVSLEGLKNFAGHQPKKSNGIHAPAREIDPQKIGPLSVNSSTVQPPYVHEHLPSFPDKHTYIQTAAQRLPTSDYQMVRQKASSQRKQTETALTKFIARTGESNYYCDDTGNPINESFPLIACKPSALSYLAALLPQDERHFELFGQSQDVELPGQDSGQVESATSSRDQRWLASVNEESVEI